MKKNTDNYFISIIILMIILLNNQLLFGGSNQQFYLSWNSIWEGKFLQLFTHPLAHLSLYHLATDLFVFLILFYELSSFKNISKYKIIVVCWFFSSVAALFSLPHYGVSTFGGLSGINYGLLTYICLNNFVFKEDSNFYRIGSICALIFLILKQILESCFQNSFFQDVHYGYVGTPIIESHAGGILGALIIFFFSHKVYREYNDNFMEQCTKEYIRFLKARAQ